MMRLASAPFSGSTPPLESYKDEAFLDGDDEYHS